MIVKNSVKENNTVKFDVELSHAEFDKYVNAVYLKSRSKIMVPGFRKGKAPRMIIEGMYGADVFYEDAVNDAAQDAFNFAVEQESLKVVGRPAVEDVNFTEEKGAVLTFSTDLYPEVTLGEYKGLTAEKTVAEVTDEEVDGEIERMRKQNSRLVTVERPAEDGDRLNIDYKGMIDGVAFAGGTAEGQTLVLGSNTFVPGFESQLIGIATGEERDIDVTFPEEYHAPELAGKAAVFHVKCNEIKFEELPALDDEFAKDNDFDTLDELKADVRANILKRKEEAADNAFTDAVVDMAVENMTADIPSSMIEERMDDMLREFAQYISGQGMGLEDYLRMMGTDINTFRESNRATAEKQTKSEVLLAAVAEAEGLTITDEEVEAELQSMADAYSMKLEDVKKVITDTTGIKSDMLNRKTVNFIKENAVVAKPKAKRASKPRAKKAAEPVVEAPAAEESAE